MRVAKDACVGKCPGILEVVLEQRNYLGKPILTIIPSFRVVSYNIFCMLQPLDFLPSPQPRFVIHKRYGPRAANIDGSPVVNAMHLVKVCLVPPQEVVKGRIIFIGD